jgi:hypothetical protein
MGLGGGLGILSDNFDYVTSVDAMGGKPTDGTAARQLRQHWESGRSRFMWRTKRQPREGRSRPSSQAQMRQVPTAKPDIHATIDLTSAADQPS